MTDVEQANVQVPVEDGKQKEGAEATANGSAPKSESEVGGGDTKLSESNNNTANNSGATRSDNKSTESGDNQQKSEMQINKDIDELAPATQWTTVKRDEAVKIRMQDTGPSAEKPVTVVTQFLNTVQKLPNNVALGVKRGGTWITWTYQQYLNEVRMAAKGFIKLGLEPYHGVGIIGFNSPEWFFSDLGAIFAGGFATGIYTTNNPEACEYVASNCQANIIVVENNIQLQKILKVWQNLPHLKAVVQYSGEVAERRDNVYSWQEFQDIAVGVTDEALQERINMLAPNKACTLIYTSGTTGNPKGVMLSHDNVNWTARRIGSLNNSIMAEEVVISYLPLSHVAAQLVDIHISIAYGATVYFAQPDALKLTWTANAVYQLLDQQVGKEVAISYLPLSHIAAQMTDIHVPIRAGGSVYFAQPDALKGSLLTTLKEVRPTAFLGVPRVWEKIQENMIKVGRSMPGYRRKISAWAKGVGLKSTYAVMNKQPLPFSYRIANALAFKKVRVSLGLDRCRIFLSGAAPITKDTLEYFYSLSIPLCEIYGMSESTGPHVVSLPTEFRICSVGKEFPGAQTVLKDLDDEGNGEILMNGRHVFMGYLGEEEKTKETFHEGLYLMSGDIGKKDKDGYVYITGRKKEIIITAGGENIAPVPVEDNVKECLPCISNCMLIGDKRKFLSMLLTLKVEVDPDTAEPKDELTLDAIDWCKAQGSQSTKVSDIIDNKDSVVLKAIQDGIDKANKKAVSRASMIQKWSVLPNDFSIPGGELGPTLKLRRPIVTKKYTKTIDAFYTET